MPVLRLTVTARSVHEVVLEVAGWVEGQDVALLEQEMRRQADGCQRLVLDLSQAEAIDTAGLELLRTWDGPHLVLCRASAYLRAVLLSQGLKPT